MLRSLSLVLNFVMKSPAAENALSDSIDVGGTVFKASMRKRILFVFSPFTSKMLSSFLRCFVLLLSNGSDFSITADLIATSSFSVRLIEDDWTVFSSSATLEDDSVPSAGVQDSRESIFFANNINTVLLGRTGRLVSSCLS